MTWNTSPINYQLVPNEELNINIKPLERRKLNNDGNCNPAVSQSEYYECYRQHVNKAIHNPEFAKKFCNGVENFGNCSIPQVNILFIIHFTIKILKIR